MKIYANTKNSEPQCLSDILKHLICIQIVDDASEENCILAQMPELLFASEDIEKDPEYDQQDEDMMYLGYTDEELWKLPPDIIHKIQNVDLLVRIGRKHKQLLSQEQQRYLEGILRQKDRVHNQLTDADINYLLDQIKNCNEIHYDFAQEKTNEFVYDKNFQFRKNAVLRVLKNLKFEDWRYRTRSVNYRYLGNTLFIFDPDVSWINAEGETRYIKLYVKLDVSNSNGLGVALVSFHEYGEGED